MALPRSVLLIVTGSVAAYKALELIRLLKGRGTEVHAILTKSGAKFITPLAISSLTGTKTYDDLFSLTDEVEMGHIELSRVADVLLVAPASADILAKMAAGIADDLATTALLATNKPVVVAPAMNHKMWSHAATRRNVAQLKKEGVTVIEPTEGEMACGEYGVGRFAEPEAIVRALGGSIEQPLAGKKAIVTSGPTAEPIDPVRYLGNRSSGKQGHAIAEALAAAGAEVVLVTGNVSLPDPLGIKTVHVDTAEEMLEAVEEELPAAIFVGAAAVADWKMTKVSPQKIKKQDTRGKLTLELAPTTDILAHVGQHKKRPALVIGFAAETEKLAEKAKEKRLKKRADWILANNVKGGSVFGEEENEVLFIDGPREQKWQRMSKSAVAEKLTAAIAQYFSKPTLKKGKAS